MKLSSAMDVISEFEGDFRVAFDVVEEDGTVTSTEMFPNLTNEPPLRNKTEAESLAKRFADSVNGKKGYSNVRLVTGKGCEIEVPATAESTDEHGKAKKKH